MGVRRVSTQTLFCRIGWVFVLFSVFFFGTIMQLIHDENIKIKLLKGVLSYNITTFLNIG